MLSHSDEILKQCNEVPFLLFHKVGITKALLNYVVIHATAGINFNKLSECIKKTWILQEINGKSLSKSDHLWKADIGPKMVSSIFNFHYFHNELKYSNAMVQYTGTWLALDHTFKTAMNVGMWDNGKWRKLYKCLFLD